MNVHYLSKKQPRTYYLSNLCKILDIFANEIFHMIEKNASDVISISYLIRVAIGGGTSVLEVATSFLRYVSWDSNGTTSVGDAS